jgi:GNAT superfamily N-acetyltransferase
MPPRPRVPHRGRVPEGAVDDDDPSRNSRCAGARANQDFPRGGRGGAPEPATGPAVAPAVRGPAGAAARPVRPEDAGLLQDGFAGLRYLTDVDHRDHEALGALDHARGGGVGIARYVRDREDPHAAEIAVTVIDGWQGRGLGTELLARLSERACQEGIRRFTAAVAADNAAMTGLLRNLGADLVGRESGTLEYEMALACVPVRRVEVS